MKNAFYLSALTILSFIGCKKAATEDPGCIERVYASPYRHTISSTDCIDAIALFDKNGIDHKNLRFYKFTRDTTQGTNYFVHVRAEQFINDLRIFNQEIIVHFKNAVLDSRTNHKISTAPNANPVLSLARARAIFVAKAGTDFKDKCLNAELGYHNTSATSLSDGAHLIKAWKVTLKGQDYPYALINDDGVLISFEPGIVLF